MFTGDNRDEEKFDRGCVLHNGVHEGVRKCLALR